MTMLLAPRANLRTPESGSPAMMTRRAWWLVILGFLLPGSAQVLAGNRKLGRVGLVATFALIGALLLGVLFWFVWRAGLLSLLGNSIGLLALEVLAVGYAILWVILGLDTLRLARLPRARPKARAAVAVVALVATLAPAALAGYSASVLDASRGLVGNLFDFAAPAVEPVDGHYTFMLLGGDAGADRVGLRPDSITVVSVNADTGAATLIGVPRNLQNVPFPAGSPMATEWPDGFDCGTSDCMINAAYTYGTNNPDLYPDADDPGIEATRDAVSGATGLTIQFYVIVDMQGFADLVDALGGIRVDVTEAVPIGIDGGPINAWINPGENVLLDGFGALWYARSRAGSNDYERMERQRQVQQAVIEQFTPQVLLAQYSALSQAGQDMVETDIPQSMIGRLTTLADRTRSLPITNVELVPPTVDTTYPDFEEIHAIVAAGIAAADAVTENG